MGKSPDLEGEKFGRLTVIERFGMTKHNKVLWKCKCDCGNEAIVWTHSLISGHTKSCGCIKIELLTKHGNLHTRIWNIWQSMKRRCKDKTFHAYEHYGGRGIKVCEEWQEFIPFYEWSMNNGYNDSLTIDRIDVNGDYCPENCRWVTLKEQSRNKRSNIYITYNGETKILTDWAILLGMKPSTLRARINEYGWSIEDAFTTPVKNCRKNNKS